MFDVKFSCVSLECVFSKIGPRVVGAVVVVPLLSVTALAVAFGLVIVLLGSVPGGMSDNCRAICPIWVSRFCSDAC